MSEKPHAYETSFHLNEPIDNYRQTLRYFERLSDPADSASALDLYQYQVKEGLINVTDNIKKAVADGMVTKMDWILDDNESGRIRIETARELTEEELTSVTDFIKENVIPNNDSIAVYYGYHPEPDTFNRDNNSFTFQEVPFEKASDLEEAMSDLDDALSKLEAELKQDSLDL